MTKYAIKEQLSTVLQTSLYASNAAQRLEWAKSIEENELDLKFFFQILKGEKKTAVRFMWFLTEVGTLNPKKLLEALPQLLDICEGLDPVFKTSFASYWLIAGVPLEQETKAIDLMFQYALSAQTNVTIKARAILVLYNLMKKYPELKNELKICILDQLDKYSKDFDKRMNKLLIELEKL